MARVFDPYARWLGIAPQDQPPNHYRLLAISRAEQDPQVIRAAADRRMDQLQAFESDDRPELIERLLGEITRAHDTLVNPHARAKYDRGLQAEARLAEQHAAGGSVAPVTAAVGHVIQNDAQQVTVATTTNKAAEDTSSPSDGFMGIDVSEPSSSSRTRRSSSRGSNSRGSGSRGSNSRGSSTRRPGRGGDGQDASGRRRSKTDQTNRTVAIIAGSGLGVLLFFVALFAALSGGSGEKTKPETQTQKTDRQRGGSSAAGRRAKLDAPTKGAVFESQPRIADLMDVLKTGSVAAKIQACDELGDFGLDARGARRTLIDVARNDPNPKIKQAAATAVGKIEAAYHKHNRPILDPFTSPPPADG